MSQTIQPRHYTPRQAALFQQRPRNLIEAVETYPHVAKLGATRILYGADLDVPIGSIASPSMSTAPMFVRCAEPTTATETPVLTELSNNDWVRWTSQVKDALQRLPVPKLGSINAVLPKPSSAVAQLRVGRISALQAAFGFTIQDLALVLSVTRQQLYKWLDASQSVKIQDANQERLIAFERIAKEWAFRSTAPLSSVSKEPLSSGANVFALMTADSLNEASIVSAFDELASKLSAKPKTRSQQMREAGFTRRPSVRALPSDE